MIDVCNIFMQFTKKKEREKKKRRKGTKERKWPWTMLVNQNLNFGYGELLIKYSWRLSHDLMLKGVDCFSGSIKGSFLVMLHVHQTTLCPIHNNNLETDRGPYRLPTRFGVLSDIGGTQTLTPVLSFPSPSSWAKNTTLSKRYFIIFFNILFVYQIRIYLYLTCLIIHAGIDIQLWKLLDCVVFG